MVLNTSMGNQYYYLGSATTLTSPIALRVEKRTEAFWGPAAFVGFEVWTNENAPLNREDIMPRPAHKTNGMVLPY
jgi:hypothetical protein